MGAYLADALRRRLARQQADGDTEGAKATEKRLAAVEAAQVDVVDEPVSTAKAETVEVVDAPKPAVKKTAAKEK